MFHIFNSQEERRKYGGSAFIEIQFCRLPHGTALSELVAVDNIKNWLDDSLYVDDENQFYIEYSQIFDCGTYNNMKIGTVDIYGINYYAPSQIEILLGRVLKEKPSEYEVLAQWLERARRYNGFYILGI